MILTELYELYQRQDAEPMPSMYGKVRIRWMIPINPDGSLRGDFLDQKGERKSEQRGKECTLPNLIRSSGVKPKLLADNGEYVLGLKKEGAKAKKVAERHEQFKALVQKCFDATQEPSVEAILKFYQHWEPDDFEQADVDPADNFMFEVHGLGEHVIRPAQILKSVQDFWAEYTLDLKSPVMTCLVTGKQGPVSIRLPEKIKGIPNGQTAGTSLVSANAGPFSSYGLKNSLTSPISRDAAEGFGKALNQLIAEKRTRYYLGPVVYTFWSRGEFEVENLCDCFEEDQPEEVRELFRSVGKAQSRVIDSDRFYALALSASGGRAVVRSWIDIPVAEVKQNIDDWFEGQKIVNEFGQFSELPYLRIRRLLSSLYRDPAKEIEINASRLISVALQGGKLPLDLLAKAVQRAAIEHHITHARAAIIKLILTTHFSDAPHNPMTTMTELNLDPTFENETDTMSYHCGRLLAHLESIQRAASGDINTTLIDRYYSAAAHTPGKIFGELVKDAQAHLRKLRVTKIGTYEALQQRMEGIMVKFYSAERFPVTLNMQQQSIFALGYYHQRAQNRKEAMDRKAKNEAEKAEKKAEKAATSK